MCAFSSLSYHDSSLTPLLDRMYTGNESVYTYTFQHEQKPECPVCGGESIEVSLSKDWLLERLLEYLIERQDL